MMYFLTDLSVKYHEPWVLKCFPWIDFRGILGSPNEGFDSYIVYDFTLTYHGYGDPPNVHITSFIKVVTDLDIFINMI